MTFNGEWTANQIAVPSGVTRAGEGRESLLITSALSRNNIRTPKLIGQEVRSLTPAEQLFPRSSVGAGLANDVP